MNRKNNVEPPINPPEPKHTHSDHDYSETPCETFKEPPSKKEQESHEKEIIGVIKDEYKCRREGCDAVKTETILFASDAHEEFDKEELDEIFYEAKRVDVYRVQNNNIILESTNNYTSESKQVCHGEPINYS